MSLHRNCTPEEQRLFKLEKQLVDDPSYRFNIVLALFCFFRLFNERKINIGRIARERAPFVALKIV
jgi:hypothetical protein